MFYLNSTNKDNDFMSKMQVFIYKIMNILF